MDYKPLRPGRSAAQYVRTYLRQEGLGKKDVWKTLEHIAGRKRHDQFTDASPATEGVFDHGPGGAYRGKFALSTAKAPIGELIGDNHPTNVGATPELGAKKDQVVYGLVDATHTGKGDITWDIYRGAHTHVSVARRNGLSSEQQEAVAIAYGKAVLDELQRYAQTGTRPEPYLDRSELTAKANKRLLTKASNTPPDAKVKKFVSGHHADAVKGKYRIKDPDVRRDVQKAFESQYVAKLPADLRGKVKLVDVGEGRNVGGSNSQLPHFYVLAQFGSVRRIVELKQIVPNPINHKVSSPGRADAKQVVRVAGRLKPGANPLMVPMEIRGKSYVAAPYDGRERELNLNKLKTAKKLVALATDDGRLTARVLAQSVEPRAMAKWLSGVNVDDAVNVLRDYAMTYDAQAVEDAHAVDELLDQHDH